MQHFISKLKLKVILSLSLLALMTGCTQDRNEKNPDHVQVRLPWYTSSGYQLKIINLSTVESMVFLAGKAAKFLISPSVQGDKLIGMTPMIHTMRTSEGIYIPEDYLSAEMLTLYAHFEKLQDFDRQIGLNQLIPHWPRQQTIIVAAQVESMDGDLIHDNAMYVADYDAFMFPPYELPNLPLSLNQAVVGHEYFHSIFHELYTKPYVKAESVAKSESTPERDQYHQFLMKGLSEGLADVWGWIYSGDFQFVSKSIPGYDQRNLDGKRFQAQLTQGQVLLLLKDSGPKNDSFYLIGTTYAQKIFAAMRLAVDKGAISQAEARLKLAKAITAALSKLTPEYHQLKKNELLDPLKPLQMIQAEIPEIKIEM